MGWHLDTAVQAFQKAVQLDSEYFEAFINLGFAYGKLGQPKYAVCAYEQALRITPDSAQTHADMGFMLTKLGQLQDAQMSLETALRLNPELAQAYSDLSLVHQRRGDLYAAETNLRQALVLMPSDAAVHSNLLFLQASKAELPPRNMLAEQRYWDKMHGAPKSERFPLPAVYDGSERRLRVGYVSGDFRNHPVGYFFELLLQGHDPSRVEVFCYATHPAHLSDDKTRRFAAVAEHWKSVGGMNGRELAKCIRGDRIDVLVDLAGHSAFGALQAFSYKPAPIQATYLGYIGATGLETMDYWISDPVLHPQDTLEETQEEIYRLPRCWVCYQAPKEAPPVSSCPNSGTNVVFGSFSNLSKLNSKVFKAWSEILHALPASKLLLMSRPLHDSKIRDSLLSEFSQLGIPSDRIITQQGKSLSNYLATYSEVDIVLDTFPRTGGTTTAEALWMGVPVITLAGQRYAERISASKLTAVGLEEFISTDKAAYIAKAIGLAHNPERRKNIRAELRDRMAASPLCDGKALAHAMENAYRDMYARLICR